MCTILTFDKKFYTKHKTAIVKQIQADAFGNGDGFSMLIMGEHTEDTNLIRALSVDVILAMLDYQMTTEGVERAWIHCRYATTGFVGLNGCHGFAAKDYTVFHNGVLSRSESDGFNVDSELIAFDVESAGLEQAIKNISEHDNYANVFIVNNQTGQFDVLRKTSGSLYTDGQGNFSTNKLASINRSVPKCTRYEFAAEIVQYRKPVFDYNDYASTWPRFNETESSYSKYFDKNGNFKSAENTGEYPSVMIDNNTGIASNGKYYPKGYIAPSDDPNGRLDRIDIEKFEELEMILDCLSHAYSLEDFEEIASYEGWTKTGIPDTVYENLNYKQLQYCVQLQLFPERGVSAKASGE